MKIIKAFPPNYADICKALPGVKGKGMVVFTYGDTIYTPTGQSIQEHLRRHEETHERQQAKMTPKVWWERYLSDPSFRFSQELEAYQTQYKYIKDNLGREFRRKMLGHISKDLASDIYGEVCDKETAKKLIESID